MQKPVRKKERDTEREREGRTQGVAWRCISRTNIDFGRTCEKAAAALQLPVIVYGKESGENSVEEEEE